MAEFLDVGRLNDTLSGTVFRQVRVVGATDSTNADAADAVRSGAGAGLVIATGNQRAGRGRLDRRWEAPPNTALALSVLLAPRRPLTDWGWLSLVAGIAVVDAIGEVAGLVARLKWPNDVMVGERKLCGILSERVVNGDQGIAVVGMGVNLNLTPDQLPVETATSLAIEGVDADATEMAGAILVCFDRWYRAWELSGSLIEPYSARSATIGREVAIHLGGGPPVRGKAVGVDPAGSLLVETPNGTRAFIAGDVVHLR